MSSRVQHDALQVALGAVAWSAFGIFAERTGWQPVSITPSSALVKLAWAAGIGAIAGAVFALSRPHFPATRTGDYLAAAAAGITAGVVAVLPVVIRDRLPAGEALIALLIFPLGLGVVGMLTLRMLGSSKSRGRAAR